MSRLLDIQEEAANRLRSRSAFADVEVLTRRKGDILNDIEAALGRLGIVAYVFPPLPKRANGNLPGPIFDELELRVKIIESPTLNQTAATAHGLMEDTCRALHHWRGPTNQNLFYCDGDSIIPEDAAAETIFDIVFRSDFGLPMSAD